MKRFEMCRIDNKKMVRGANVNNACGVGIGALWMLGCLMPLMPVNAGPSTSPSARAAARLKNRPPAGWIRHYLPDDRYKIKGGSWKYVSTELDTYYHRPDSPLMLRQSPNGVIGFNSAADAEEAGYRPAPNTNPDYSKFSYDSRPEAVVPTANMGATGVAVKSRRITLSDGVSTVVLPAGWRKVSGNTQEFQGTRISIDAFQPAGRGVVLTMTINAPANVNLSAMVNPQFLRASQRNFSRVVGQSGQVDSRITQLTKAVDNSIIRSGRLGGLPGVLITPKKGTTRLGGLGRSWMAARGSKMYGIDDYSKNARGLNAFVSSFRPR